MSGPASKKLFDLLHAALASELLERVKGRTDEDGNPIAATAADLGVARQFLKDNNVSSVPVKGSPLANLLDTLPYPVRDDEDATLN